MAKFMEIESINRKLGQNQIAKELGAQLLLYNDINTI